MPKKACCCKPTCCDPIFYSNFIILAGETMDDAAPVDPDDVVILTMNRPGGGNRAPQTIYGTCPNGQESLDCYCIDCEWLRANWCTICDCNDSDVNCEEIFRTTYPQCGPLNG